MYWSNISRGFVTKVLTPLFCNPCFLITKVELQQNVSNQSVFGGFE